jgi:hypothetical protein
VRPRAQVSELPADELPGLADDPSFLRPNPNLHGKSGDWVEKSGIRRNNPKVKRKNFGIVHNNGEAHGKIPIEGQRQPGPRENLVTGSKPAGCPVS